MRTCKKIFAILMLVALCMAMWGCGGSKKDNEEKVENESVSMSTKEEESSKDDEKPSIQEQDTTKKETIKVKNVVGKSLDNAKTILKGQGFEISVEEEYSKDVQEGYVISQSPSAENELLLSKGDVITVIVSKGKEPVIAQYLDSIVYSNFVTGNPYNRMSAFEGADLHGNTCKRAIKFECNNYDANHKTDDIVQSMKVTYLVNEGIEKFTSTLTPVFFANSLPYVHVNLYKDDTLIYSMDISKDTKPLELSFDILEADTFSIELTYTTSGYNYQSSIAFSDAKFE